MNKFFCFIAIALTTLATCSPSSAASVTTGFVLPNAFLDDNTSGDPLDPPDGVNWTFNSPWQLEAGLFSGAALFVTDSSNQPGFFAAEGSPRDLTAEANVLALDGYDPSTTRLTSLTFADPWRLAHFGTLPPDGQYNYFIEYTINTPGGAYRAATQKLDRATAFQNTTAQLGLAFSWQGGGFLGDPFAAGGVPLSDIDSMTYNVFIEVLQPTSAGAGFFLVEGFNVEYEVTAIPEPASIALVGLFACGLALRRTTE